MLCGVQYRCAKIKSSKSFIILKISAIIYGTFIRWEKRQLAHNIRGEKLQCNLAADT